MAKHELYEGRDLLARWALSEIRGERWGAGYRLQYRLPAGAADPAVAYEQLPGEARDDLVQVLLHARQGLFDYYELPVPDGRFRKASLDMDQLARLVRPCDRRPWPDYVAGARATVEAGGAGIEDPSWPIAVRAAGTRPLVLVDGHRRCVAAWLRGEPVEIMVPEGWRPRLSPRAAP